VAVCISFARVTQYLKNELVGVPFGLTDPDAVALDEVNADTAPVVAVGTVDACASAGDATASDALIAAATQPLMIFELQVCMLRPVAPWRGSLIRQGSCEVPEAHIARPSVLSAAVVVV
jgi:hypothetical protein